MQEHGWVYLITSIMVVIIGSLVNYFIHKERNKHQKKLQETIDTHLTERDRGNIVLSKDLDKIVNFIQSDSMNQLLQFITNYSSNPQLLSNLETLLEMHEKINKLDDDFQQLKEPLDSMQRMLNEKLFNPVTALIHQGIEKNTTFITRLKEKEESKKYLENHWLNISLIQYILTMEDSIFIESGSTLAYCMLSIIRKIRDYRTSPKTLRVCTNNVAIYMMLLFEERFIPVLLPGKPNNPYAATFADIKMDGSHSGEIIKFLKENEVKILFTTASYLDIDYGPHVSSTQNHSMKRILNEYANSLGDEGVNIFVIAGEKINQDVKNQQIDRKCKLIFDEKGTEDVLHHPDVLEKSKQEWATHIRRPNNYIISGSYDVDKCVSALDDLQSKYDIDSYKLTSEGGLVFTLPNWSKPSGLSKRR